jgi:hypothetical protein
MCDELQFEEPMRGPFDYPQWRKEELARKYAAPDCYDPDDSDFDEED